MQGSQAKLKILVAASFGVILIVWIWWISQGGLSPRKTNKEIKLFDDLAKAVVDISSNAQEVKDIIKQDISGLRQAQNKKEELILQLKSKIEKNYSTNTATSTIDQIENEKEER